jgi:hypothetical protein
LPADSLVVLGGVAMDDLFLLSEAQMRRIEPYFPLSHGIARVDDRRVISGIVASTNAPTNRAKSASA